MKISTIDKNEFLFAFEQSLKDAIGYDDNVIDEGMRYAALDGGKRVRPLCVYYGARSTGKDAEVDEVVSLAVAVELIHNYSLVHDDLPAMDNDDYRRGKLSVHKKFGHANRDSHRRPTSYACLMRTSRRRKSVRLALCKSGARDCRCGKTHGCRSS